MASTLTLPNGVRARPYSVKCYRPGCRRRQRGYLSTERTPGGKFYNKRGKLLADLRETEFACAEHGVKGVPFLYPDLEKYVSARMGGLP